MFIVRFIGDTVPTLRANSKAEAEAAMRVYAEMHDITCDDFEIIELATGSPIQAASKQMEGGWQYANRTI